MNNVGGVVGIIHHAVRLPRNFPGNEPGAVKGVHMTITRTVFRRHLRGLYRRQGDGRSPEPNRGGLIPGWGDSLKPKKLRGWNHCSAPASVSDIQRDALMAQVQGSLDGDDSHGFCKTGTTTVTNHDANAVIFAGVFGGFGDSGEWRNMGVTIGHRSNHRQNTRRVGPQ